MPPTLVDPLAALALRSGRVRQGDPELAQIARAPDGLIPVGLLRGAEAYAAGEGLWPLHARVTGLLERRVERHLSRVHRKLGIGSRDGLARLLSTDRPAS